MISVLSLDSSASSLPIENALSRTAAAQVQVTRQLTTGSRINSGSDDPAGLSIADGIDANVAALYQSAQNVTQGLGALQTADGALSTIVALLNRCVTLATEASNGIATQAQNRATDHEFQSLLAEVNNIAVETSFNGAALFQPAYGVASRTIDGGSYIDPGNTIYNQGEPVVPPAVIFTSDATAGGSRTYVYQPLSVDARALGLTANHRLS